MNITLAANAITELFEMDRTGVVEPDTFVYFQQFNPSTEFAPLITQLAQQLGAQIERIVVVGDDFWVEPYAVIWLMDNYFLIFAEVNANGSCYLNFKMYYFVQTIDACVPHEPVGNMYSGEVLSAEPVGVTECRDRKRHRNA